MWEWIGSRFDAAREAQFHAAWQLTQLPQSKMRIVAVMLLRDARESRAMPTLHPIEWRLDGFALVRSVTLPKGSRYEIRKSWKGRATP